MLRVVVIVLSAMLTACGGDRDIYDPASDNHGFGYEYDAIGPRGLRLRYKPVYEASSLFADVALFERMFDEVQRCTGLFASMPFVIVQGVGTIDPFDGYYHSAPPLIRVESLGWFKHEAIHYLLDVNAGNADAAHTSPHFSGPCMDVAI